MTYLSPLIDMQYLKRYPRSRAFKDKTGETFGPLTVLEVLGVDFHKRVVYLCKCKCEKLVEVPGQRFCKSQREIKYCSKECGLIPEPLHAKIKREYGITYTTYSYRLRKNQSPELPKNHWVRKYTFNGESLTNKEWCKRLHISKQAFAQRIKRYGVDDPRTFTENPLPAGRPKHDR